MYVSNLHRGTNSYKTTQLTPTDDQNMHRDQPTTTTSGKGSMNSASSNRIHRLQFPTTPAPYHRPCRSHPPDQATITLCSKRTRRFCSALTTWVRTRWRDSTTSTIRRNGRGRESSAKRLRRTRDTTRNQSSMSAFDVEPSCDRESMYIVPPHAFYRASGKVLGGFVSFSVEELARFAKSWPCRAR
jgi:hypothetical protein